MTVELSLTLDEAKVFALASRRRDVANRLCDLIKSNREEVERLLPPYCVELRGEVSHESASASPENVEFGRSRFSGKVEVEFTEHVHMGCRDIDRDSDMTASIRFDVDLANRLVTLTGADRAERDPDEI